MTVHARPDYALQIRLPPPEGYPGKSRMDRYEGVPFSLDYQERRRALLEHILRNPAPNNTKAAYYELARIAAGGRPHDGVFHAALDYIDARKDCADFVLHSILRLLYAFAPLPPHLARKRDHLQGARLSADLLDRARQSSLHFKYWPDELGLDSLCTWTENHYILYTSAAYLAGQLYPDEVFANSGQTGRQKMELNRPRILRWLHLRYETGFSEWLSHVYYDEDLTALLSLVDYSLDEELRRKAEAVIHLLVFDMALNSFRGIFGSTHGRAYGNTKKWVEDEGTADTEKLLFGMGIFSSFDNMSAIAFALSERYSLPPVLEAVAGDLDRPELINRQRMGLRVVDADRWGLGYSQFEDGMHWLTLEAYLHPRTVDLTLRMFDAFNWWDNAFFSDFLRYRPLIRLLRRAGLICPLARWLEWDLCRNTREEANLYTYRTPDYMLSTAQDYRPGFGGDQQHIWQATLGPGAVSFTTHPARPRGAGPTPDYWAGSGVLPRAAQVKNVLIAVYHLTRRPALYTPMRFFSTHAWLPRDRFDEVVESGGWVFARKGDGYLALRSQHPYTWNTEPGEDQFREILADRPDNIWICEMGRRAVDGDFSAFTARLVKAPLHFDRLSVVYESPSQGRLEFGWSGPFRQNGVVISLRDYPRYDNLYASVDFPAEKVKIKCEGDYLEISM